jgi:hypothetical protein
MLKSFVCPMIAAGMRKKSARTVVGITASGASILSLRIKAEIIFTMDGRSQTRLYALFLSTSLDYIGGVVISALDPV